MARAAEVLELLELQAYTHRPWRPNCRPGSGGWPNWRASSHCNRTCCCSTSRRRGSPNERPRRSAATIDAVRRHLGATIVIIDHDVPLMRSLVDRLYVLAAGEVIARRPAFDPRLRRPCRRGVPRGRDGRSCRRARRRSLIRRRALPAEDFHRQIRSNLTGFACGNLSPGGWAADCQRSGAHSPFGSQHGQSGFQRTSRAVSAPVWSSAEKPIVSQ